MKKHFVVSIVALLALPGYPAISRAIDQDRPERQAIRFNEGWYYTEDSAWDSSSLQRWTKVTLPHSWNVWDAVDPVPGYRRAVSWYKKEFSLPVMTGKARVLLTFEGVNIVCDIFINGQHAFNHVGGYIGFDVDITRFLTQGGTDTIIVRVSNEVDPDIIPSQKSDFCIYGGITRDVWLRIVPMSSIAGVKIQMPLVTAEKAEVIVNATIHHFGAPAAFDIVATAFDRKGKEICRKSVSQKLSDESDSVKLVLPTIKRPDLWSPDDPALYTLRVELRQGKILVDRIEDRFGCRWFEFKDHGPFFLNGKRLLLRGTHRHEDYAGYANAIPDSLHRKDMVMIKDVGANFVRLAHYPQDPEVYRACDELGILVWDELPWCRGGMGGENWRSNTRRLLGEQINRYYNHPCIIIHSLGNELNWLPDVPGGDQPDSLRAMLGELNILAHRLDPYRLTATRKYTEGTDLVDVVSPSLWPGWYSGNYFGLEKALINARKDIPHFFHAEYGGDSHLGRHTETPVTGDATVVPDGWEENIKPQKIKNVSLNSDWSENYIVDLFDWYLHITENIDWFAGNAQWAFKDFPTPLRPENPIPFVNQKGLVDRAGKPKDAYYVFKSYWTTSPLFCYIESHTWTERIGSAGAKRDVNIFSNCEEVELFVNAVSQGKKVRKTTQYPACGLSWQVEFAEGQNSLLAMGFKEGKNAAADSMNIQYSLRKNESPDHIELSSTVLDDSTILVIATAVDKNGQRCLDYNKRIYFAWDGTGQMLINYGTYTRSSVIEMANGKAQIEFRPASKGRAVIEARNQDFKGAYLVIEN